MSKEGLGIGAGIGAFMGLIISWMTPSGVDLLPLLTATQDVQSAINTLIIMLVMIIIGAVIGGVADQIAGLFK
jgi:hypothetical protein